MPLNPLILKKKNLKGDLDRIRSVNEHQNSVQFTDVPQRLERNKQVSNYTQGGLISNQFGRRESAWDRAASITIARHKAMVSEAQILRQTAESSFNEYEKFKNFIGYRRRQHQNNSN